MIKRKIVILSLAIFLLIVGLTVTLIILNKKIPSTILDSTQFSNKTIFVDGENRILKYNHEYAPSNKSEIYDIYIDNLTNSYHFNHKTGQLEGFVISYFPKDTNLLKKLEKEQIKIKADSFIKKYIDITKYSKLDIDYIESMQYYQYTYTKTIQSYKTTDCVGITLTSTGVIEKYGIQNIGIFNNVKVPKIDNNMMTSKIDDYMKKHHGDVKYSINSKTLDINQKGRIIVKCEITFNTDSSGSGQGDILNVDVVNGDIY